MAVWDVPAKFWALARKLEDLLALQQETKAALRNIDTRLHALETRVIHLEADRSQIITEAKAAAGIAATAMASSIISDIVTRVTRLEMRQTDSLPRLPPTTKPE